MTPRRDGSDFRRELLIGVIHSLHGTPMEDDSGVRDQLTGALRSSLEISA